MTEEQVQKYRQELIAYLEKHGTQALDPVMGRDGFIFGAAWVAEDIWEDDLEHPDSTIFAEHDYLWDL